MTFVARVLKWLGWALFVCTAACIILGLASDFFEFSHRTFLQLVSVGLYLSTALLLISVAGLTLWVISTVLGLRGFRLRSCLGWLTTCVLSCIPFMFCLLLCKFV